MSIPQLPPVSPVPGDALQVRRAGLPDIETLVSLNAHVQSLHARALPELFRDQTPSDEVASAFRKMIEDPSAVWLLAETGQPAGYLYAQFHERPESWARPAFRVCNINHIAVHPAHRRLGIARRLIAALVAEAEKRGFARIELDVWSFNQEARTTFDRLGFEVFNERRVLNRTKPFDRLSEEPKSSSWKM
jgi:ribosomal protein S18 acetylase RimI-like enzyme